jgi:hypothetical protein
MDWKPFLQMGFEYNYGAVPDTVSLILNLGGKLAWIQRVSLATGDIRLQVVDKQSFPYDRSTVYDVHTAQVVRVPNKASIHRPPPKRMPKITNHLEAMMTDWDITTVTHGFFSWGGVGHIAKAAFHQTPAEYVDWMKQEVSRFNVVLPADTRLALQRSYGEVVLVSGSHVTHYDLHKVTITKAGDQYRPIMIERIATAGLGSAPGAPMDWIFEKLAQHFHTLCDPLAWKTPKDGGDQYLIIRTQPRPPRKKRSKK